MTQNSVMTETLSYKNQSMDWFLHDRDLRYEGVKLPVSLNSWSSPVLARMTYTYNWKN